LKGKSRSILPQDGSHIIGYDAPVWIKTEDGRNWFEDKPRQRRRRAPGKLSSARRTVCAWLPSSMRAGWILGCEDDLLCQKSHGGKLQFRRKSAAARAASL
jgi:hypothetical protein